MGFVGGGFLLVSNKSAIVHGRFLYLQNFCYTETLYEIVFFTFIIVTMEQQIKEIFQTRDRAVAEKNKDLLLSTQINEIPKSGSDGYLKTDKLVSKVLYIHQDDKDLQLYLALIQEDYFYNGKFSHRGYLLYKLRNDGKLLITEIIW